jgi:hypothetical protein
MAKAKETVQLSLGNTEVIQQYLKLDAQIKRLTKQKELLAAGIKGEIVVVDGYDEAVKYEWNGLIKSYHRKSYELDQQKTMAAFKKPALRDLLYPTAVLFKPGANKQKAINHGLLIEEYGDSPVIEVL